MTDATSLEAGQLPSEVDPPSRAQQVLRDIVGGSSMISVLAVVLALVASAVLIVLTDKGVQAATGYFFSRPGDTLKAIWDSVAGAYAALFQGSIYNFRVSGFAKGIKPLTETLTFATPLIVAGLGVAVGFRAGMFNIGGRGQMLVAAGAAGYVAFAWPLPYGIHLVVAVAAGMVAGGLWGGIAGLLKARTGAHEVITTIMLNYVGFYFISYLLQTPGALQAPGSSNPKSPAMLETAIFPKILGSSYNLHLGFVFAIIATVFVWYLINRSSMGF
ncbi:MAG: ABC transporter permease, partial [Rhodoglobus sp.]|nr:ABC transporter permease [Rhodoglobus sp.]